MPRSFTSRTTADVPWSRRNQRMRWTGRDIAALRRLADGNTPTRVIALTLGRSEYSVQRMASRNAISLMPANRSPYGTRRRGPRGPRHRPFSPRKG